MTALDERALVGALLSLPVDGVLAARELFDLDDLDDARHRVILVLVDHCVDLGVRPDPAAVFAAARSTGQVPSHKLGLLGALLGDLYGAVGHPQWYEIYARGVVEASVRRKVRATAERLTQAADAADVGTVAHIAAIESLSLAANAGRLNDGGEL
jgi:hypothetical protein